MICSQVNSLTLIAFTAAILVTVPEAEGRLIRFEHGYSYHYQYDANVTLEQVDTFQSTAKVIIKHLNDKDDASELLLGVEDFKFKLNRQAGAHDHRPDFSKWFSFLMSEEGHVRDIFYPAEEDTEVLTVKQAIVGLLAGTYLEKDKVAERFDDDFWSYTATEIGPEGNHTSMYTVVPNSNGKVFTKKRVLYKHPLPHADSSLEKVTYIDETLGTINSTRIVENMTANHRSNTGFDPYFAMRKVDAVNEFEETKYPSLKAFSTGELRFIIMKTDLQVVTRPAYLKSGHLHLYDKDYRKQLAQDEIDVSQQDSYIQSNLTCMRKNEEERDVNKRLECFRNLVTIMRVMPLKKLRNITNFYLGELKPGSRRNFADQNAIIDALGAMETNISQNLLSQYVFNRQAPDDSMIQRALIHVATMQGAPNQNILTFLYDALDDSSAFCNNVINSTCQRILLASGSCVNKLIQAGLNEIAGKFNSKLQNKLGIHDPWKYRERRHIMTEEEKLQDDIYHVILLEALGNGNHDESYEYILSHLNATNSPWIKRAGIHALRKYHHHNVAEVLHDLSLNDENEEVRYEAMLQYDSHPKASKDQSAYSSETEIDDNVVDGGHKLSRNKRGILDKELKFNLAAPGVDWRKRVGSSDIGGSFGVIMQNYLNLQVSLLSGLFRVSVHDEVYARVHLGFLGLNFDYFSARICFKGGTQYDVNILQEYDPRLNRETLELVTKSLDDIISGIQTGIDTITFILNGPSGEMSFKNIVDEFLSAFKNLPNQILNLRSNAVKLAREIGELVLDQLPPFIQPVKDLADYTSNLLTSIKSDFTEFYNSLVQAIEITIPNAAETIYKSARSIIETFPKIFKDPKTALARIGKGVTRIAVSIKQMKRTKQQIENTVFRKVLPYWSNMNSEFEKLAAMVENAYNAIKNKAIPWIDDIITGEDPIDIATGGKMKTKDVRRRVVQNLQNIIDSLYLPFAKLRKLGQLYSEKFSQLFSLVADLKVAYENLKTGYKQARSIIETIFGPKCHTEFPRLLRSSDSYCSGKGSYPSQLGLTNTEYEHRGIDIVIESGKPVVSPFSGEIMRTSNNEIKIANIAEMITDTEIIITNIQPASDIYHGSDTLFVKKEVAAGDNIGSATQSPCAESNNHIHFAVLRNGKPIDPTRFLQPRQPSLPKWEQECDEYRVVYKGETIDTNTIVGIGGHTKDDTSGHLPKDSTTPASLHENTEPEYDHDSSRIHEKLTTKQQKKGDIFDGANSMIDILVEKIEAFLEHFSIRRITVGEIAAFIHFLELENSKTKMIDTLRTLKNIVGNRPCKPADAMTNEELKTELDFRGIAAIGSRADMLRQLSTPDERCPLMALALPESKYLYCMVDSRCLGIQCCMTFRIANLIQVSYQAYVVYEPEEMSITFGIAGWKEVRHFNLSQLAVEDKVKTGIRFELLDWDMYCRYAVQVKEHQIAFFFWIELCSSEDTDVCPVSVNMLDNAVFPLPVILENGTVAFGRVDWDEFFSSEAVATRFKEAGRSVAAQTIDALLDEFIFHLGIPEEMMLNNPMCPIPENLPKEDLDSSLKDKGLPIEGPRSELEYRLRIADRTCKPADAATVTFPEIQNDVLKRIFYYNVSDDCLKIDACLDITIGELNITKTLSAFIEILPCNFEVHLGIEKWRKTYYLIDYDWGAVKEAKLTESIYLSFMLDKEPDTNKFVLDVELVVDDFNYRILFIPSLMLPIPGCNGRFELPGKGDLMSLARTLGGELSEDAFRTFLSFLGVDDTMIDQKCDLPLDATDCKANMDDYIPELLSSNLKCVFLDNCWGFQCCLEFSFDIPFSSKSVWVSIPFMFRYDPCEYNVAVRFGQHYFEEWVLDRDWGVHENITIGKGAPIVLR